MKRNMPNGKNKPLMKQQNSYYPEQKDLIKMKNEAYNLYHCEHTNRELKTGMGSTCHPYKILCDGCKHLKIDKENHNQMSCEFGEFPEANVIREWLLKKESA